MADANSPQITRQPYQSHDVAGVGAVRTFRAFLRGVKVVEPSIEKEALNVALLDSSIDVRDHINDKFPQVTADTSGSHILHKILLCIIGFVLLGMISGFMLNPPCVLIQEMSLLGVPNIDIGYVDSTHWSINATMVATLLLQNFSRLRVQIPLVTGRITSECLHPHHGVSLIERLQNPRVPDQAKYHWERIGELGSALTRLLWRRAQDVKIPINNKDFNWGMASPSVDELPAETAPLRPLNATDESPALGSVHLNMTGENTSFSVDSFMAYFALATPDRLEREPFPLCFGLPLSTRPLVITGRSQNEILLSCNAQLTNGSPFHQDDRIFACPDVNPLPMLHTSFWKSITRSKVYMKEENKGWDRPSGSAVQTRVEDIVEACREFGHVWMLLRVENLWYWSLGNGGWRLLNQTTVPMSLPCSVS